MNIDGLKLDMLQKERGLNNFELAQLTGVSHITISRIRNDQKTKPMTIRKLAHVLGVRIEELLPDSESQDRKA